MKIVALVLILMLGAAVTPTSALADQAAATQTAPDAALTARFAAFLTDVLAGHLPSTGLSDKMKSVFTPDLIAEVDNNLAPLGAFQSLQFVSQDSVQGFQRYHYSAVFAKGTQPLMFVVDSAGNIAGFFKG